MERVQTGAVRGRLQVYHFQLGLFERGFIWNNVVFLMEGVKQEELVPLGATALQSTGLWSSHRRRRVMTKKNQNFIFLRLTKYCIVLP